MGGYNTNFTTRAIRAFENRFEVEFDVLYDKKYIKDCINKAEEAYDQSNYDSANRDLYEALNKLHIQYERDQNIEYYNNLADDKCILEYNEDNLLVLLYNTYQEYASPRDYMKRIVDRLCTREDGWENDSLRLRILKQFIKYGNYLQDAGYGGMHAIEVYVSHKINSKGILSKEEILENLDENVFNSLTDATYNQTRPMGRFGLLRLADDLANGNFRQQGATKRGLYLFAMVFGMTFSQNRESTNRATDIEINLFRDYYTNNLMRFISRTDEENTRGLEREPSDQGINYKNYAEMIYLYYISRNNIGEEKIRLSQEMISRVKGKLLQQNKEVNYVSQISTIAYRGFFAQGKLSLANIPEADFEKFICNNYVCNSNGGPIEAGSDQNSAFREYKKLIKMIDENLPNMNMDDKALSREVKGIEESLKGGLESCDYGVWFVHMANIRVRLEGALNNHGITLDEEKVEGLIKLLEEVDSFLKDKAALSIDSPKKMTRTALIVAYYYYYNSTFFDEEDEEEDSITFSKNGISLRETVECFKNGINPILEEAFYQKINMKNIFDVIVMLSSYAYLNM